MTKRMLIDATHAEETRVVVLDGSRLEDFDFETAAKRQLKGNIYLAKVVRVEPSLQAAFVEYGGNRHGFLAFGEIHPDYYQIPIADREALLAAQEAEAREEAEAEDRAAAVEEAQAHLLSDPGAIPLAALPPSPASPATENYPAAEEAEDGAGAEPDQDLFLTPPSVAQPLAVSAAIKIAEPAMPETATKADEEPLAAAEPDQPAAPPAEITDFTRLATSEPTLPTDTGLVPLDADGAPVSNSTPAADPILEPALVASNGSMTAEGAIAEEAIAGETAEAEGIAPVTPPPEILGGGDPEEREDREAQTAMPRFLRNYKIQEVIKRRQILLVQVVKEERGTKGAALTTYISLAGRFSVLMPNSPRGGGISRKITAATDRRRLKEVTTALNLPRGMGLIVRTAGAQRPKTEIIRDCDYLMRLWDEIREQTLRSIAPALIYEEASLIKRAIRDVYSRDVEEILVDGETAWRAARDFMRMLMPAHASKVRLWTDPAHKLFARHAVDAQLDVMLNPTVQLKSGGYLVINQTEALVAIDVNSGRSTRERNIEETALRTNLEAADEAARQLRLRDLAGLIVIDFIDMEHRRNNASVEKRLKDALKEDRARIQVGTISHFGLLEMSRQRLRPSLAETALVACPHCQGSGQVRSIESAAIHVLRALEEEGAKRRASEIVVHAATAVALYLFNHKRDRLAEIERRYAVALSFAADERLVPPEIRIDRVRAYAPPTVTPSADAAIAPAETGLESDTEDRPYQTAPTMPDAADSDAETSAELDADGEEDSDFGESGGESGTGEEGAAGEHRPRRRRRRRGRGITRAEPGGNAAVLQASPDLLLAADADRGVAEGEEPIEGAPETTLAAIAGLEKTGPEGADLSEEDPTAEDQRGRRRGRRGGRRRRRDDGSLSDMAALGADQPDLGPAAYAGPTPADPFGGGFDIFDVLDQVEAASASRAAAPEPEPASHAMPALPAPAAEQPAARHAQTEAGDAALETVIAGESELNAKPVFSSHVAPPIVIGSEETQPVAKKRGWWRR